MKNLRAGFTLVELIVVIAVLGVLAGIAIPRFVNANMAARGSKILADMNACESAINIYYVKNGDYPLNTENLISSYMANWPKPTPPGSSPCATPRPTSPKPTSNASSVVPCAK